MSERLPPLGTLTDRVQLRRREMVGDPEGGHVALFVPITSVWARVRSLAGRFGQSNDGRGIEISHAVVLRYRTDIKPGDRIVYRERSLEVVSTADINGRRAYLSCACSETAITG